MTKDRRLGRGLAALLGTPIEEQASSNSNNNSATTNVPPNQVADRTEVIQSLAREARERAAVTRPSVSPIAIPTENASTNSVGSVFSTTSSSIESPSRAVESASSNTRDIPVTLIDANPFQPRRQFNPSEIESLAESIKEHQQLQPILVRRVGERYQLISGERRLRATIHAQLPTIRAEIRVADDRLVAELAIIENLQRKDLNAIEKALSFKRYITEHRCTQDELAQRLKIDRSTIANMMRLLELPEAVTDAVQQEQISAGHAKALLSLGSVKEQIQFLQRAISESWSVRETESRVAEAIAEAASKDEGLLAPPVRRRRASKSDQINALETELKMLLGTRVEIAQTSRGRGRITIHFTSIEEFERIRQSLASDTARSNKRAA